MEKIKELENVIKHLDTLYEAGEECKHPYTKELVTDNEYDAFKRQLYNLYPQSTIFDKNTSSEFSPECAMIKHDPPMTSIAKCNGEPEEKQEILRKWMINRLIDMNKLSKDDNPSLKELSIKYSDLFCMSLKRDGVALSLYYKRGNLISAALRHGDGNTGFDVTEQVKFIDSIPKKFKVPWTICLRGELECKKSVFDEINEQAIEKGEKEYANPRNFTAGSIHQFKNPENVKDRNLSFVSYSLLHLHDPQFATEIECETWVRKNLNIDYVKCESFSLSRLQEMEENHREENFMIDGVVISVNDFKWQKQMGNHGNKKTGSPRYKIAFKFSDQIEQTVVREIQWATGRTGNITPVLIIEPISLEGTKVSRCTAHNLSIIKQNKIGVGSEIEIIKSGKIIPKLHKIIEAKGKLNIPKTCPSCDFPTEIKNGNNDSQSLVCNNVDCPAQNIKNLNHYLKAQDIKGIAEKNIERLVDNGLILKRSDFYNLTLETLLNSGITERTAILTLARIWMIPNPEQEKDNTVLKNKLKTISKITIPMEKFIASFGMDGAGKEVGKLLSKKYQNFDKIRNLTISELESIDGIGFTIAQNVVDFFSKNKKEIDALLQFIIFETLEKKSGKLDGKTFVLSGSLEGGKAMWQKIIEEQGGIIKSGVSKNIDYLISGEGSGLKTTKALELGIPILTTDDLEKLLN